MREITLTRYNGEKRTFKPIPDSVYGAPTVRVYSVDAMGQGSQDMPLNDALACLKASIDGGWVLSA